MMKNIYFLQEIVRKQGYPVYSYFLFSPQCSKGLFHRFSNVGNVWLMVKKGVIQVCFFFSANDTNGTSDDTDSDKTPSEAREFD